MKWQSWEKDIPDIEGEFWMRDESNGRASLYIFEIIDGTLMNGPKARSFRWEADGTGHIPSAEFKRKEEEV